MKHVISEERSKIRSYKRGRDIFIHGILPRCGTNFLMAILAQHRQVVVCPRNVWEFPHLTYADKLVDYNRSLSRSPNLPELSETDLLPYLGDALLAYLSENLEKNQRMVLKEPTVKNLIYFFRFFPQSFLIILVRDGRDIAASSLKTNFAAPPKFVWSQPKSYRYLFRHPLEVLAHRWNEASHTIFNFIESTKGTENEKKFRVIKYEELLEDLEGSVKKILDFVELDQGQYNWDGLFNMKVKGSSFINNKDGELDWRESNIRTSEFNPVGRWKQWSEKEKRIFQAICGETLHRWKY